MVDYLKGKIVWMEGLASLKSTTNIVLTGL